MFTGLVQCQGLIQSVEKQNYGIKYTIQFPQDQLHPLPQHGDSVAVNGCCLTHTGDVSTPPGTLIFHVIQETLNKTALGQLQSGDKVNLEPAVTANTPMGGHFVQGHVDACGQVTAIQNNIDDWRITIQTPPALTPCIIPKGSICIQGVSLTIASCEPRQHSFQVALIPTTLEVTNLGQLKVGDPVNLEGDMIVKSIVHFLNHHLTQDTKSLSQLIAQLRSTES